MKMRYASIMCLIVGLGFGCSDSTDTLVKGLKSDIASSRVIAQDELVKRKGDPETAKKVATLLENRSERTVFIAIQTLGELADSTAVPALQSMAESPNPVFRAEAVRSLGKIGSASAWPMIERALSDTSKTVRANAVTALGTRSDATRLPMVFGTLRDPAPSVRAAAVRALYVQSDRPEAGIKAAFFQGAVQDSFTVVRYVAAQALGKAYPDTVITEALLLILLEDQDRNVRIEAIRSLGKIRCSKAVPILKKNFVYSTYEEQTAISETIKTITGEEYPKLK